MTHSKSKIIRTWKGWTTLENASIYEDMLINEVFPTVKKNGVTGLEKVSISTCASWMCRTLLFWVACGTKLLGVSSNPNLRWSYHSP